MRWTEQPWANPDTLIAELEVYYAAAVKAGAVTSHLDSAVKHLIASRGWAALDPLAVRREAERLEVVYCPVGVGPGPGLIFPIRDTSEEPRRLHIRLLGASEQLYGMRYMSLVDSDRFHGPAWIGGDDATVRAILRTGEALLVEGPMDLLAIRLAGCPVPSLCPLSKRITDDHLAYLRIIQAKKVYVLFDVDPGGQGQLAAEALRDRMFRDSLTEVAILTCPAHDPSEALQTPTMTYKLRQVLDTIRPTEDFSHV